MEVFYGVTELSGFVDEAKRSSVPDTRITPLYDRENLVWDVG